MYSDQPDMCLVKCYGLTVVTPVIACTRSQYFTAILLSSTQDLQMQLERGCETAVGGSLTVLTLQCLPQVEKWFCVVEKGGEL